MFNVNSLHTIHMYIWEHWCDSFIIDSHVIIVSRHRAHANHFIYWTKSRQTHGRQPLSVHIIYEHMFCSCWSFAITLTTWSFSQSLYVVFCPVKKCEKMTVPRLTWYKRCSLRMAKNENYTMIWCMRFNWDGGNFMHSWQNRKNCIFFSRVCVCKSFFYLPQFQVFNSWFSCVN